MIKIVLTPDESVRLIDRKLDDLRIEFQKLMECDARFFFDLVISNEIKYRTEGEEEWEFPMPWLEEAANAIITETHKSLVREIDQWAEDLGNRDWEEVAIEELGNE